MIAPNKDGPAFPIVGTHEGVIEIGMTLRDYFAAKAMQGFLSAPDCGWDMSEVAVAAYHMADAMLAARRPSPELDGPGEEDGPWAEGWEQRCVAYRAA